MLTRAKIAAKKPETKRENSVSKSRNTEPSRLLSSPIDHILFLQRTIGNQAVQRLFKSGVLQAKLRIGQPNDIYEQEADRVAEQVMRMTENTVISGQPSVVRKEDESVQRKPTCAKGSCEEEEVIQPKPLALGITPLVQRRQVEGEILQTKEASGQTPEVALNLESQINSLRGSGQPLPESVRAFFEPRFGYDFSRVGVHSGTAAEQSTREVNANAYAVGHNIVFGAGQFAPGTHEGRRLIANELTHVVQQSGAKGIRVSQSDEKRGLSHFDPIGLHAPLGVIQRDGALEAWLADLQQRRAKVLSMAKDGSATLAVFQDAATGKASGYQLTQNFHIELDNKAVASNYCIVQWIKGELHHPHGNGKAYWPASMGLFGRKNTDPWLFSDWIVDTPDADPRFGSNRGVVVSVPAMSFEDSPGIILSSGVLPENLTWDVDARVGIYPWGSRIPTDIAGWESQKPEPFREVKWGWTVMVDPGQKSFTVNIK